MGYIHVWVVRQNDYGGNFLQGLQISCLNLFDWKSPVLEPDFCIAQAR